MIEKPKKIDIPEGKYNNVLAVDCCEKINKVIDQYEAWEKQEAEKVCEYKRKYSGDNLIKI